MSIIDRTRPSLPVRTAETDRVLLWLGLLAAAGVIGVAAPLLGALLDGLILVALGLTARSRSRLGDAAAVLMLVPLLRLLWVTIIIEGVPPVDWTLLIAAPFAVATNLVARSLDVTPHDVGMGRPKDVRIEVVAAVALGAAGLAIGALLGAQVAWATSPTEGFLFRAIGYAVLIAYAEELAFRGVMPHVLERHAPGLGYALALVAYAMLALGAGSVALVVVTLGLGIATTLIVRQTGSLWGVIAGHAAFLILLNV